jgi:hypothetical protein
MDTPWHVGIEGCRRFFRFKTSNIPLFHTRAIFHAYPPINKRPFFRDQVKGISCLCKSLDVTANDAESPLRVTSVATVRENAMESNPSVAPVPNDLHKSVSGRREGVPKGGVTGMVNPESNRGSPLTGLP